MNIETMKLKELRQLLKMADNELKQWQSFRSTVIKELKRRNKYEK